jgi:activator of HSP90 ATPase
VPLPDHPFSLFNGNVTGKVISATSPSELVMSWRPPTWQPADHYGTLKLSFVQQDESTLLKINLTGVPESEEESAKSALDEFYLNGLRRLGLGSMI